MTPLDLMDELKTFLEQVVKDYVLDCKISSDKIPQVVLGWLPVRTETRKNDDAGNPDFPYVVVQLETWEDKEDSSKATVSFQIGTYSKDMEGWRDTVNIMTRIRTALLYKRVIGRHFRLELPINSDLFDDQPYSYWIGAMTTNWIIPQPQEIIEEVDVIYGQG